MSEQEKIDRWKHLKDIESEAKKERASIEQDWIDSGLNKINGESEFVKVSKKDTVAVDQILAKEMQEKYDKIPFRVKFELDKKLYDSIMEFSPEAGKEFSRAVTFKPARPSFEIKEMNTK